MKQNKAKTTKSKRKGRRNAECPLFSHYIWLEFRQVIAHKICTCKYWVEANHDRIYHCWKHSIHTRNVKGQCKLHRERTTQYNNSNNSSAMSEGKRNTPLVFGAKCLEKNRHIIRHHHFVIARDANSDTVCSHPPPSLRILQLALLIHFEPTQTQTKSSSFFLSQMLAVPSDGRAFVLQNNYFCLTITFLPLTRIENVYLWLHTSSFRSTFFPRISWLYLPLLLSLSSTSWLVFSFVLLWAKDEPFAFSFIYCHLSSMPGHLYIDRKILYKSFSDTHTHTVNSSCICF